MALTDGLVLYHKLDETTGNAADSVWSNTGTANNVTWTLGKINNGAQLSGAADSYIQMANYLSTFWDNPYTLSMWIKPISRDTVNGDVLVWPWDRNQQHIITGGANGKLEITTFDGTVNSVIWSTTISNWTWYHVFFQRINASTWKIYVNNVEESYSSNAMRTTASNPSQSFRYGSRQDATWANANILFDEIGFWNRILDSTERAAVYNSWNGLQYPFWQNTWNFFLMF